MKQSWADNLHALGSAVQQAMALHAQDSDGEIKEMWEKILIFPSLRHPPESVRLSLFAV